jgi:hypothetical protein
MLSHGYGGHDLLRSRRRDSRSRWLQRLVRPGGETWMCQDSERRWCNEIVLQFVPLTPGVKILSRSGRQPDTQTPPVPQQSRGQCHIMEELVHRKQCHHVGPARTKGNALLRVRNMPLLQPPKRRHRWRMALHQASEMRTWHKGLLTQRGVS